MVPKAILEIFKKKPEPEIKPEIKVEVDEEEEWVPPPQPPVLRKVTLGSKGEFSFSFSEPVKFPSDVLEQFEADKLAKKQGGGQRRLKSNKFLSFSVAGASNGKEEEIEGPAITIEDVKEKSISMKIKFDNPAAISLGDQSIND